MLYKKKEKKRKEKKKLTPCFTPLDTVTYLENNDSKQTTKDGTLQVSKSHIYKREDSTFCCLSNYITRLIFH